MMRYTFQEMRCLLILRSDSGCMLECPRHGTELGTLCSRISLGCPGSFTRKELLSQTTADTQSLHLGLIRPHSLPPSEIPGVFLFTCVGVPQLTLWIWITRGSMLPVLCSLQVTEIPATNPEGSWLIKKRGLFWSFGGFGIFGGFTPGPSGLCCLWKIVCHGWESKTS